MKEQIQGKVRLWLVEIARRLPANQKPSRQNYPQLWYCMPGRYRRKRAKIVCTGCGNVIKEDSVRGAESSPAGTNWWCESCSRDTKFARDAAVTFMDELASSAPQVYATQMSKLNTEEDRPKHWIGWWLRPLLQWLCGKLSGHEISKTEWGYGGGMFVDRNCRWCDKRIKVPKHEDEPPNDTLKKLAGEMGF